MSKFKRFFFIIIFFLGAQSCNPQGSSVPSSIPATETVVPSPTPSTILHPARLTGQQITIALGDVFVVSLPDEKFNWQINFADTIIQALTPPEAMNNPGSEGWLFRAIAPGLTDIRVTASAAACPPGTPCPPPAPITFVFTIEVK
jgi:hypothetical protein